MWGNLGDHYAGGIEPAEVLRQVCGMLKKPGGQPVYNRGSEEDEAEWGPGPHRKQEQEAQPSLSSRGWGWREEERRQLTNMPSLFSLLG